MIDLLDLLVFIAQIVPLFAECLLTLVCEGLVEVGLHTFREPFHRRGSAAISYALIGAIAGGISLFILPTLLIGDPAARSDNLLVSPILAGFLLMGIRAFRSPVGESFMRLDAFRNGALFALSLAFVRLMLGH